MGSARVHGRSVTLAAGCVAISGNAGGTNASLFVARVRGTGGGDAGMWRVVLVRKGMFSGTQGFNDPGVSQQHRTSLPLPVVRVFLCFRSFPSAQSRTHMLNHALYEGFRSSKGEQERGGKEKIQGAVEVQSRRQSRQQRKMARQEQNRANRPVREEIFEVGPEGMPVQEVAQRLAVSPGEVVKRLFMKGIMAQVNQVLVPRVPVPLPSRESPCPRAWPQTFVVGTLPNFQSAPIVRGRGPSASRCGLLGCLNRRECLHGGARLGLSKGNRDFHARGCRSEIVFGSWSFSAC